ncbi:MAG: hypothetical protein R3F14_19310 [Polyangiaceae bacterium]
METLADRIARDGPLDELDAVGWAIRLAKRIEGMHALGVAHGSLSPSCILLDGRERDARARLLDVRRATPSLAYQSPERAAGGPISQADDAWALACTLYAALTGTPPFSGIDDDDLRQKIAASSPAPLAVFDVGDDDLQHIFDAAFARDLPDRTASVGVLRRKLEEWHPDPAVGALPGIDDDDSVTAALEEDDEDERTIMRPAPHALAMLTPSAVRPAAPPAPVPPPRASAPGMQISPLIGARPGAAARAVPAPATVPMPRASQPGAPAIPPARGSQPGAVPAARGSQPGFVPTARASQPGLVSAARGPQPGLTPSPRASQPGLVPPARASQPGLVPAARASQPGLVPPARASQPGLVPPARASQPGGFPPPSGPPAHLQGASFGDDEEDDDEKTMMRAMPQHLAPLLARDAARSGAFAAAPPAQSGSFAAARPRSPAPSLPRLRSCLPSRRTSSTTRRKRRRA